MATFTNKATLSYNGRTTDSNTVTGTIRQTLSVTKNALLDEYSRDDNIVYVINLINSGNIAFTDLTVTDNLGGYEVNGNTVYPLSYVDGSLQYYVNGMLQPDPAVTDTVPLTVNGISVPAGGNVTLIYIATVTEFAPLDTNGTINNTVSVTGDCIINPITATETIRTVDAPELTITKALSPTNVIENGTLTYTFTIQNYGNTSANATDDVVVTDVFDPILRNLTVTFEGEQWTAPANYTYNTVTGLFETVAGQITVPAATFTQNPDGSVNIIPGSVTLTVTGTV